MIDEKYNSLLDAAVDAELTKKGPKYGRTELTIRREIIDKLVSLNNSALSAEDERAIIQNYGFDLVATFRLGNSVVPQFNSFGRRSGETMSQTDAFRPRSATIPRSDSMPADRKEQVDLTDPSIIAYRQQKNKRGNEKEEANFEYIKDFEDSDGKMSECMKAVLRQSFDPNRPNTGNIFTAIAKMRLSDKIQTKIFNYIVKECVKMTGNPDPKIDEALIQEIAANVREMIDDEVLAKEKNEEKNSRIRVADADFGGGSRRRRSRRYKKRRSTLKRRRMKRRRTRKGKKRRHTKKR
jgi:hypothetical protein